MSGSSKGSGSALKPRFARDVPRSVQAIVRIAADAIVAPLEGERGRMRRVEGGMPTLQQLSGDDHARTTRRKVAAAEALGLMRRSGSTHAQAVYVLTTSDDVARASLRANMSATARPCAYCGAPAPQGQWCWSCQPAFRRDRAWKQSALNLLHDGKSLPSIAAALGQPLYPGPGDGPLVGVVANLLAEVPELVPPAYREGYRAAVGEEHPQLWSVLTSRGRQRRLRRQGL